jgi:hypothetical protein
MTSVGVSPHRFTTPSAINRFTFKLYRSRPTDAAASETGSGFSRIAAQKALSSAV